MSAKSGARTILVCHGAWSGGWSWKKMFPLAQAAGYRMVVPTYTGLGEREHLANPAIDLETHIQDILGAIRFDDLNDIILLGIPMAGWLRPASPIASATASGSSSISMPSCRATGSRCSISTSRGGSR